MIGRIHVKRLVKRAMGILSVAQYRLSPSIPCAHACVFTYHRVADVNFVDRSLDDWNVSPTTIEQHLRAAKEVAEIVHLRDLPGRLATCTSSNRPLACLTFDDGYANFHQHVLPLLERYDVPATLFVPTSQVAAEAPMSFDRWGQAFRDRVARICWRAISWDELEACVANPLVAIGSHSHWHLNAAETEASRLVEESQRSREILVSRLGSGSGQLYAYPYGCSRLGQLTDAYVEVVRQSGYEIAVSTDLGLAKPSTDWFRVPRIEAHGLDWPSIIKAKLMGFLAPYRISDKLRKSRRK